MAHWDTLNNARKNMKVRNGEKGVVAVVVAILLLLLLGFVALVVDIGFGLTAKTQLQAAADSAALAGAARFNRTNAGITTARNDAILYAGKNKVAGASVTLPPGDVEVGSWDKQTQSFRPILLGQSGYPDTVDTLRVTLRQETAIGTALKTSFARLLGRPTLNVRTIATAKTSGPSQCVDSDDPLIDCNLSIPVVLCSDKITHQNGSPYCQVAITVYPTISEIGALTSFFDPQASVPTIKSYIDGDTPSVYARSCLAGCDNKPPIDNKSVVKLTNGADASIFKAIRDKYDEKVSPCLSGVCEDADGNSVKEWKTYVAVISCGAGSSFSLNGTACVVGFAKFNLEEVCVSNQPCNHQGGQTGVKGLFGFLKCQEGGLSQNAGTGGRDFGTMSPVPGLVQ